MCRLRLLLLSVVVAAAVVGASSWPLPPRHQHHQYPRRIKLRDAKTPALARLAEAFAQAAAGPSADNVPCPSPPPLIPMPPLSPNTTQRLETLRSNLDAMFTQLQATGGSAALVYDQNLLLTHSFGSARAGENVTVTGDTVFRLASITKVFTALMLFKLRDAGKVSLEDQVWRLPNNNKKNHQCAGHPLTWLNRVVAAAPWGCARL